MNEARALISVFHELNASSDRKVSQFTSSLIGLFGSIRMFDDFLADLDRALSDGDLAPPVKERAANLLRTYIPQVAQLNGFDEINGHDATADQLRVISTESPQARREGVRVILAALIRILDAVNSHG